MTATLLRIHPGAQSPCLRLVALKMSLLSAMLLTGAVVAARNQAARELVREWAWIAAAAILWAGLAALLLLPGPRTRASVFALTLPIPARRLWLASALASIRPATALAVVVAAMLVAAERLMGERWGGGLFPAPAVAALGAAALAAFLLAWTALEWPAPERVRWPVRGWRAAYAAAAVALPGAALIIGRERPLAVAAGCLAGAGLLGWLEWRRQPGSFLIQAEDRAGHGGGVPLPGWKWLATLRWGFSVPVMASTLLTSFLFGAFQAVFRNRYSEDDETGLLLAPMLVYVMIAWLGGGGRFVHRLSALPVSRRALAAWLTVPPLAGALAGYCLGLASHAFETREFRVEFQARDGHGLPPHPTDFPVLRTPARFLEIAWDGRAPELRAPWGENRAPWQFRLWKGASPVLYSPFAAADAGTPGFAAWTISRALAGVYGVQVPWQTIRDRYLETGEDGKPRLQRDLAELAPGARVNDALDRAIPPLTIGLCGAAYLLIAGWLFGLRRAGRAMWKRNAAAAAALAFLMILYIIRVPLAFSGMTRGWAIGGALSSITRAAVESIPGGAITLWVLCVLAIWLAFEFAVRRLERAEILAEPPRRFGF